MTTITSSKLYSILWVFNGREEWEDYYGTRKGLHRFIREVLACEEADAVIRIEEGEV